MLNKIKRPMIFCGGAGNLTHFKDLFENCKIKVVAASSIFAFTQNTPNDIKMEIKKLIKMLESKKIIASIEARMTSSRLQVKY